MNLNRTPYLPLLDDDQDDEDGSSFALLSSCIPVQIESTQPPKSTFSESTTVNSSQSSSSSHISLGLTHPTTDPHTTITKDISGKLKDDIGKSTKKEPVLNKHKKTRPLKRRK